MSEQVFDAIVRIRVTADNELLAAEKLDKILRTTLVSGSFTIEKVY